MTRRPDFGAARALLADAVTSAAFPAAVVETGTTRGALWAEAFGTLGGASDSPPATLASVFDLASLTKVIATTPVLMRLVEQHRLALEEPLQRRLPEWRGSDRAYVTIEDLLAHASGLTAHLPFYRDHSGRREFELAICTLPLEYAPRSRAVYSDLGFMLLAFLAADAGGRALDELFADVAARASVDGLLFRPPVDWIPRSAPTGVDTWRGRLLRGEVHDRNAWALGGVAGHAGLFGTAAAVSAYARAVLATLRGQDAGLGSTALMRRFATRTSVPYSSRALGWDTMLPTSSCGTRLSPTAIGHTGFTGTSLWIDWERDLYVVLLTNRVHPDGGNDAILSLRPALHDAISDATDTSMR